jgi:hypothetical protein
MSSVRQRDSKGRFLAITKVKAEAPRVLLKPGGQGSDRDSNDSFVPVAPVTAIDADEVDSVRAETVASSAARPSVRPIRKVKKSASVAREARCVKAVSRRSSPVAGDAATTLQTDPPLLLLPPPPAGSRSAVSPTPDDPVAGSVREKVLLDAIQREKDVLTAAIRERVTRAVEASILPRVDVLDRETRANLADVRRQLEAMRAQRPTPEFPEARWERANPGEVEEPHPPRGDGSQTRPWAYTVNVTRVAWSVVKRFPRVAIIAIQLLLALSAGVSPLLETLRTATRGVRTQKEMQRRVDAKVIELRCVSVAGTVTMETDLTEWLGVTDPPSDQMDAALQLLDRDDRLTALAFAGVDAAIQLALPLSLAMVFTQFGWANMALTYVTKILFAGVALVY